MSIYEITFSPTGGTGKAAHLLTGALGGPVTPVDLTDSRADFSNTALAPGDVAVIAVPSYAGRVPAVAGERLSRIRGGGARAVLLCVYGNRAYEDTLAELEDLAGQAGFRVVAAVAAVAEHSIARRFAAGRPDGEDAAQLQQFAGRIRDKLAAGDGTRPAIPGNRPYKAPGGRGMVPLPTGACTRCGACARQCPVQAIDPGDPGRTDGDACISCMRCVAVCPQSARQVDPQALSAVDAMLSKVCAGRKEGELYL